MKNLKLKDFEVKDARIVAKFLVKTGLKETLYSVMFPKDNANLPKNWIELRAHLQNNYNMSDEEFKEFRVKHEGKLDTALAAYAGDFPAAQTEIGSTVVDVLVEVFADDVKYEATTELFAHLFSTSKEVIEALKFNEVVELVSELMTSSGFFDLPQPSTPQTQTAAEPQE